MANPTVIIKPIAADSATKVTPPPTAAAAGFGRMSLEQGYPPETQVPLETGGKAPKRDDMNGALNLLSLHTVFLQSGGRYLYNPALTYNKGCEIVLNNLATPVYSTIDNNPNNPNTNMTGWALSIPASPPAASTTVVGVTRFATVAETFSSSQSIALTPGGLAAVIQSSSTDVAKVSGSDKLMRVGAFGLGGSLPKINDTAINALTVSGFYNVINTGAGVLPTAADGYLIHNQSATTGYAWQSYVNVNGGAICSRTFTAGVWSGWYIGWDSVNLVKQTSQTDVTPGRVLLNGAWGWGAGGQGLGNARTPYVAQLNAILPNGMYLSSGAGSNCPDDGSYTVLVQNYDSQITQTATREGMLIPIRQYIRKYNGTSWSAWYPIANASSNTLVSAAGFAGNWTTETFIGGTKLGNKVTLQGSVTCTSGIAANQQIASLPANIRPVYNQSFVVDYLGANGVAGLCVFRAEASGILYFERYSGVAPSPGLPSYNIRFNVNTTYLADSSIA